MLLLAIESKLSTGEVIGWITIIGAVFGCVSWIVSLTNKITAFTLRLSASDSEHERRISDCNSRITKLTSQITRAWDVNQNKLEVHSNRIADLEEYAAIKSDRPFVRRRYSENSGQLQSPDNE